MAWLKCEFSVTAPIPQSATVIFTLREPTVFKTSVILQREHRWRRFLQPDVGSDVSLDIQPEGTSSCCSSS